MHILCFGITPDDHEWLQAHAGDVEPVADYLREHEIACALAHPFYAVEAPLTARHRRRLAELFDVWEVRNGARAPELNAPAASTSTPTAAPASAAPTTTPGSTSAARGPRRPPRATPREFLDHLRAGRVEAHGEQGSAAKWAHAAMAIARARARPRATAPPPDPGSCCG